MKERTLVVVASGLSQPSTTSLLANQLATATRDELNRLGVPLDIRVVELRDQAHDVMNNLLTGFPSVQLTHVIDAVAGADGLITVTPIFNASYSGLFKAFFDVLPDESLVDKPILIAATGGTARHSLALEHALRPLFAHLHGVVVPTSVFAASEDWAGANAQGALRKRIERAAHELAGQIASRDPFVVTDPFALSAPFSELLGGN